MTRYKAFGSFVAWYIGPCKEIARLRKLFRKKLWREVQQKHPYQLRTYDQLLWYMKSEYFDPTECEWVVKRAYVAFNSPGHTEWVEQGRGWHSKTGRRPIGARVA